jgi:hypothetical protein
MYAVFISLLGASMAPKVLTALGSATGLIFANLILGVLLAMKTKTFDVRKLPQFLEANFVPYIGGLLILALFSGMDQTLSVLFLAVAAAVHLKFLADIKDQVVQLFGDLGFSIQSPIAKKAKPEPTPVPKPQSVTPSTDAATNTPAAEKTVPEESKEEAPATVQ